MATGIDTSTLSFLKKLQKNNNREWFTDHKKEYEAAMQNFREVVQAIAIGVSAFDPLIGMTDPAKSIFRIYRDVRFSKDKSPYKTHFGAHLTGGAKMSGRAGYYIHITPEESFIGGGLYGAEPGRLRSVREHIAGNGAAFKKIINDKTFVKFFNAVQGTKLVSAPKGFDKNHPMIEYIKHKDLYVGVSIDPDIVLSNGLAKHCVAVFKALSPFNNFLNAPLGS